MSMLQVLIGYIFFIISNVSLTAVVLVYGPKYLALSFITFQSSKNHSSKVKSMVKNIDKFEYIITDSELEALILECNLIKKYKPKYNVLLRDE
jgi:hypothetical protein